MRLIDIEKRMKEWAELCGRRFPNMPCQTFGMFIRNSPTIDAAPVRHEGTTTFIDTDDIDTYQTRIILTENKKSKFCRVFYEDYREHGRWMDKGSLSCRCSECGCKNTRESAFCPNCGAKMNTKEE